MIYRYNTVYMHFIYDKEHPGSIGFTRAFRFTRAKAKFFFAGKIELISELTNGGAQEAQQK